jgi:hemoglobin-like flavoprotein
MESARLADGFYQYLWSVDDETRNLFSHPEAGLLQEKFLNRLSLVVSALDEPELLVPLLAHLGARHHGAGLGERQYVLMGEALLHALRATLGEYWNSAVHLAWAESYTFIASIMKRAGARASGAHTVITE